MVSGTVLYFRAICGRSADPGYTYSDDSNDKFLSLAVRSEFTEE